jgi:hypothetical protein
LVGRRSLNVPTFRKAHILCEQLQAQVWFFSDLKNVPSVISYLQLQIVHCLRGNHKHLQPVCFDILLQHLAYPNLRYLYSLPIVNFSYSFIQFTLKSEHHHWCPAKQPRQRQLSDQPEEAPQEQGLLWELVPSQSLNPACHFLP